MPEINDIRGVDSGGVIGTLLDRKLITTSGRKQVIGRPILYKTTKEFLMRFGLKDVNELPSMEEFEKLVAESFQAELIPTEAATEAPGITKQGESEADASEESDGSAPEATVRRQESDPSEPEEIEKSAAPRED
jgi:segregation and condensation protein B